MSLLRQLTPGGVDDAVLQQVEYALRLAAQNALLSVLAVRAVSNPTVTLAFDKHARAQLVLDSWIDARHLSADNALEEVCSRGFRFPASGMIFPVGLVALPEQRGARGTVLLCRVLVGKAYALQESELLARPPLPPGFSSYYVQQQQQQQQQQPEDEQDGVNGGNGDASYYHEYLLLDPSHVLPVYVVDYEVSAAPPPLARLEGNDALATQYRASLAAMQDERALEARRRQIATALQDVDTQLQAVRANASAVEDELYQMLQNALVKLEQLTREKCGALLGEELELRRQLQFMEWSETFVRASSRALPPDRFVRDWSGHQLTREAFMRTPVLGFRPPLPPTVIEGSVSVANAGAAATPMASAGTAALAPVSRALGNVSMAETPSAAVGGGDDALRRSYESLPRAFPQPSRRPYAVAGGMLVSSSATSSVVGGGGFGGGASRALVGAADVHAPEPAGYGMIAAGGWSAGAAAPAPAQSPGQPRTIKESFREQLFAGGASRSSPSAMPASAGATRGAPSAAAVNVVVRR